jgi:hypothetical protein
LELFESTFGVGKGIMVILFSFDCDASVVLRHSFDGSEDMIMGISDGISEGTSV